MGVMVSNEGKACDAIIRFIEQCTGEERGYLRRPENDHVGPPVDFRLRIGTVEYAIEHTISQVFKDQISTGVALAEFFAPVKRTLSGKLPGLGAYWVKFPTDPRFRVRKDQLKFLQESLVEWIRKTAHTLEERASSKRIPPIYGTPEGFQYEIGLSYHVIITWQGPGCLDVFRSSPNDLEAGSVCQLQRELRKKLPKLYCCKCEGARTVLVLEDVHSPLRVEASPVGKALAELRERFTGELSFPDEIYFVVPHPESWWVWCMKYDDRWWSEKDVQRWKEFDVGKLTNLSGSTATISRKPILMHQKQ